MQILPNAHRLCTNSNICPSKRGYALLRNTESMRQHIYYCCKLEDQKTLRADREKAEQEQQGKKEAQTQIYVQLFALANRYRPARRKAIH